MVTDDQTVAYLTNHRAFRRREIRKPLPFVSLADGGRMLPASIPLTPEPAIRSTASL